MREEAECMALMGLVYTIESAHQAFGSPLHGHSFKIEIILEGKLKNGTVAGLDFREIREEVEKAARKLDKRSLNEIMETPTVENIAVYLIKKLRRLPVKSVKVWETSNRYAEVSADEIVDSNTPV